MIGLPLGVVLLLFLPLRATGVNRVCTGSALVCEWGLDGYEHGVNMLPGVVRFSLDVFLLLLLLLWCERESVFRGFRSEEEVFLVVG